MKIFDYTGMMRELGAAMHALHHAEECAIMGALAKAHDGDVKADELRINESGHVAGALNALQNVGAALQGRSETLKAESFIKRPVKKAAKKRR